jgi:hypothetical protein
VWIQLSKRAGNRVLQTSFFSLIVVVKNDDRMC